MDFVLKAALTASIVSVVILAGNWLGEYVAGVLSGLPFAAAPALLFIGLERGAGAAADAAVGGILGCGLASLFALVHCHAARRFDPVPTLAIAVAALAAGAGVVHGVGWSLPQATVATCLVASVALGSIGRASTRRRGGWAAVNAGTAPIIVPQSLRQVVGSAAAVGLVSAAVTMFAVSFGSSAAGIVAAMPMVGIAVAGVRHAAKGRDAVTRYLQGYVVSSLAKTAFCAAFAVCVVPHGMAVAFGAAVAGAGLVCGVAAVMATARRRLLGG